MVRNSESKLTTFVPWMEVIGRLIRLEEQKGVLLAEIANHDVVLPLELKDPLTPHMGQRIALLRTDIPGKQYLFRVLPEFGEKNASMTDECLCENEQISSSCEVM